MEFVVLLVAIALAGFVGAFTGAYAVVRIMAR